jgi:hypothetical protein
MHIIYTQNNTTDVWGPKGKAGLNLQCWMEVTKDLSSNSKNRVNVHCGGKIWMMGQKADTVEGGDTHKQT